MASQKKTLKVMVKVAIIVAIISNSEDDLFFLDGELVPTCHFK